MTANGTTHEGVPKGPRHTYARCNLKVLALLVVCSEGKRALVILPLRVAKISLAMAQSPPQPLL